jgi:hypothetical protein
MEHQHMKRTFRMTRKSLTRSLATMMLGIAALIPVPSASYEEVSRTAGGVSYVSGGVGTDSIDRLTSLAGDFNLKLVFALNTGAYVSDVRVTITDPAGNMLLDTMSEGPWLLARLPAGNYQVVASFAGSSARRQVAVGSAKLSTVDFRWVSDKAASP